MLVAYQYNQNKRSGFTLVKLSIVLVIIGLLTGGILIGQSLIESAKTTRFINDLISYEVEVVKFHNKFKKYPGDSPRFTPAGTGNNVLHSGVGGTINPTTGNGSGNCSAAPHAALSNMENYQVWAHLSQAQMLSKSYAAYSPRGTCPEGVHNSDYANITNAGIIWPYTELSVAATGGAATIKYPIYVDKNAATFNLNFMFVTNPLDTLAIENKLGSKSWVWRERPIGLVNEWGVGNCNAGFTEVHCADSGAQYGRLFYFLAPL